jgi:hypothetical protein
MRAALVAALLLATVALADPAQLDGKYAAELHRRLAKEPTAQRLLVPSTCVMTSAQHYHCTKHGCMGACQVIEASADVLVSKRGDLAVHGVAIRRLGDTGECGCCMGTHELLGSPREAPPR